MNYENLVPKDKNSRIIVGSVLGVFLIFIIIAIVQATRVNGKLNRLERKIENRPIVVFNDKKELNQAVKTTQKAAAKVPDKKDQKTANQTEKK